jgi:hypothetical protein
VRKSACASCGVNTAVGLVEDQHAGAAANRLHDLHALLLADRELPDLRSRIDRHVERLGRQLDLPRGVASPKQERRSPICESDVLGDREGLDQAEVLVHHADARLDRVARRVELDRPAVHLDLPLVRAGRGP